jgi:hypothetical protein
MSLPEIMAELFYNDEMPLILLKKHNLEDLFEKSIQVIKVEIQKKPIDFGKFRDVASNVLVTVNSKLREIDDPLERRYLESILRQVAEHLLSKITKSASDSGRLIKEIRSALETTASLKGYNFEALVALLSLNQKASKYMTSRLSGSFYYKWNASDHDLSDLIQTLKSAGWIYSLKDFRTLFSDHGDEGLMVQFNKVKVVDLLALFDVLKSKALITPKGCKGHFYPLKRYLVDLENNLLIQNDPKTIKMVAKRNHENWKKLNKNALTWVSGYKTSITNKLPWSR